MICFFLTRIKQIKNIVQQDGERRSVRLILIHRYHLVVQEDEEEEVEAEGKSVDLEKNFTSYDDR